MFLYLFELDLGDFFVDVDVILFLIGWIYFIDMLFNILFF